ncbi:hydantoinase B/oxoprolinase [Piromyces finnis]|uniref:Hydantoinase B/oxoprolinase n=1 Tax=Piromyces finnis TaxID=1754191 RepID=A0A1Y1VK14_9FUNG|nr:hydantoinase B/oxoprolinase [Piromyces finnis]|eukprot:ORX57697.1 hydantoinase B/oxoprolinase [Piromyces finnis]
MKIRFCIDRGGTFTDCLAFVTRDNNPNEEVIVTKLLSVDPNNYKDAPTEAIRRVLENVTGVSIDRNEKIPVEHISQIRMGTTVATNALLERKGEPCALLITKGLKDLLFIGNQARDDIFDLNIKCADILYTKALEVDERIELVGYTCCKSGMNVAIPDGDENYIKGVTGEYIKISKKPDEAKIKKDLMEIYESGIRSVAICFLHSYIYPEHEEIVGRIAKEIGFTNVTLSSKIMPMIKIVPRGNSVCADAYLTPCIQEYINGFIEGFDPKIKSDVIVEFMQSDGGLVNMNQFSGFKAILSGPAAGVIGYAKNLYDDNHKMIIGFDMGGTSTDVSRYAGELEHVYETKTAGITIQAPQLDINTVAAGGGSKLFFRNGMFIVGPESGGADPGPACYRKGGSLTITDCNLILGRLMINYFPKIFGKTEDQPLDIDATTQLFDELTKEVNDFIEQNTPSIPPKTVDEVAYGFLTVANEAMCRPIREMAQSKGYNTSQHVLACFGGAGSQHACAIAKNLGIKKVWIHKYASVLSAYGLSTADVVYELQEPCADVYSDESMSNIKERIENLIEESCKRLKYQGFKEDEIRYDIYLNLRYDRTNCALMILKEGASWDFETPFVRKYRQEFGFDIKDRDIIIDDIRVRGIGNKRGNIIKPDYSYLEFQETNSSIETTSVFFENGRINTEVYLLSNLKSGNIVKGPALIINDTTTIVVEPQCEAYIYPDYIEIEINNKFNNKTGLVDEVNCDPIQLSIFSHRFMSIAEQMGRTLQQTSISTNIKERLDFSCAIFGPDGGLISNAPHIPVHLGSMQEAVKCQIEILKDDIQDGDVLVSNHPEAGGSHLPDITVITPVFQDNEIVFFVASRGHHADIGGLQPGSMPPSSKRLYEEGAAIRSFKLVHNGVFDEEGITKILVENPKQYDDCSGTRCLNDNISDLKAQVAANQRGILLVKSLIVEYGLKVVQAYMKFIRENAELAVRNLLKSVYKKYEGKELIAEDFMDDGTKIKLKVTINPEDGSSVFDFTGTGYQVYGNWNAPRAITYSAIIYCLRAMVGTDIPLNQGCLAPVKIIIPEGSILSPKGGVAVVGGNVLTSQRICDVILKAFNATAASQGCMNNITFGKEGDDGWGYYEIQAGGSGAGPTWHGRSGIHTHMTNTRITDPEILEKRYPVILKRFEIRENSGGRGEFNGGDGVIRELEFLEPLQLSVLTERRVFAPYGLEGGENGMKGENIWIHNIENSDKTEILNIGGKNTITLGINDRIIIKTPGGGGWGKPKN